MKNKNSIVRRLRLTWINVGNETSILEIAVEVVTAFSLVVRVHEVRSVGHFGVGLEAGPTRLSGLAICSLGATQPLYVIL